MNDNLQLFLEFALTHNVVFVLMFGALVPIAADLTVRRSLSAGLKHGFVLAMAGIVGSALLAMFPDQIAFLSPVAILVVAICAASVLHGWGELGGEWAGVPRWLLAVAPMAGLQLHFWITDLRGLDAVLAAFGAGVGYYFGIVMVVTTIEQIRIAEAPVHAKRLGTLFFAIAIFALGFSGFQFL